MAANIPADCMIDRSALASLSDRAAYRLICLDGNTRLSTRGVSAEDLAELAPFVHINYKFETMCAKRCAYSADALSEGI